MGNGAVVSHYNITERRLAEEALQKAHDELERRVEERTEELAEANLDLREEIENRKRAERELQRALAEIEQLKDRLQRENIYLRDEIKLEHNFEEIIGQSDALKYVLFKVEQVAPTDATALILGETGTGKELVARAIHNASSRGDRPLVKVNCATLPSNLIESELFGHEKGAFTGAQMKQIGRFELADGGTIFLDEIGELPLDLQVKLLRVLQDGEFERLGSSRTIKSDVRVIAATNRNLKEAVRKGRFREDLWYRLNVFPITVPPLRQRREDIPLLVKSFVQRFSMKMGKVITTIAPQETEALQNYSWPGNVRELENVIERAVIVSQGPALSVEVPKTSESITGGKRALEEVDREHIVRVLEESGWRIEGKSGAAQILGLNPGTLRSRMKKLGIKRPVGQ
jgi:transcriptional regulator with GAF, ATPase, and Fis domain